MLLKSGLKKIGHSTADVNRAKEMILILLHILAESCPLVPKKPTSFMFLAELV